MGNVKTLSERERIVAEARRQLAKVGQRYENFHIRAEAVIENFLRHGEVRKDELEPVVKYWVTSQMHGWRNNVISAYTQAFWSLILQLERAPPAKFMPQMRKPGMANIVKRELVPKVVLKGIFRQKLLKLAVAKDLLHDVSGEDKAETLWWYWLWEWKRSLTDDIPLDGMLGEFVQLQQDLLEAEVLPELEAGMVKALLGYHNERARLNGGRRQKMLLRSRSG